jgi:hypothetical protein
VIQFLRRIKHYIINGYDKSIANTWFGNLVGYLESYKYVQVVNKEHIDCKINVPDMSNQYLIGTSNKGLMLFSNGKLIQLLKNNGVYGITSFNNWHYAFYKTGLHGSIIKFHVENDKISSVQKVVYGLSRGVHQIDIIGNDLYITDTYNNAIRIYNNIYNVRKVHWLKADKSIFPSGKLMKGRLSSNYKHFNSIYSDGNILFVLAHNETKKTNRKSELFALNVKSHGIEKIHQLDGSNCHNIYLDDDLFIYLKSIEGTMCVNNYDRLHVLHVLTRGLSITDTINTVGGSDIQYDKTARQNVNGYLYFLDAQYEGLGKIVINKTQINEIRCINAPEYTYSNYSSKRISENYVN